MNNYCFEEVDGVLKSLKTDRMGLSADEAEVRLKNYGLNEIEKTKSAGIVRLFFSQFKDFMTLLLIAAAAVSGLIAFLSKDKNDLTDTFIILAIIFMNAVVGTIQQYRADKAIENLKKLSASACKVRRDGKEITLPCEQVTVGDIVLLEEGDIIPADCRIIECNGLLCDEAALTGESGGVEKSVERIRGNSVALGNMKNTLFGSSFVLRGNGEAVVTEVGMNTQMGKIASMLEGSKQGGTPLENSLNKLGKIISIFVLAVTAVIFGVGLFVRQEGILKNFMTAVAVAVAAIPEGLPAVVTIIMAMGVQKMSKKKVVIRKLKCVETLGSCSVICSDKTGTLTCNELRVEACSVDGKDTEGEAFNKLLQCMTVCNGVKGEKGAYLGDPTEIALKKFADSRNFHLQFEKTGEIPFTSERKMMTVSAKLGGERLSFTKGAPDILINHCECILTADGVRKLTAADKKAITEENDRLTDGALRVLGFAYRKGDKCENGLIFIGLCGLSDGIKEGVKEAVADCKRAGITTVMITGDHVRTAYSVAKKLGIADDINEVMTGEQLDVLDKKERDGAIEKCRVFARVSPKHKNMIVKSLQKRGKVVAMTGDGINDAPSIKSADIGIAMGVSGTDVTKSASDMVIADDNFTTIVTAVREGRRISSNIKKTICFFLSTNLAEVLAILFASLFLFKFDFLLSTQLLWLNLITDSFPVLALGAEREDTDSMHRPPERSEKSLFSKTSLVSIAFYGLYITVATLGIFLFALSSWGNEVATTMTFMTISFLELFQAFNIRTERVSAFGKGMFSNRALWLTVLIAVAVNILLCVSPLSSAFGLVSLSGAQWGIVFAISLSIIPVGEIYKFILRLTTRRHRDRLKSKPVSGKKVKIRAL
ncbi:MAG: calcium-translocating P-type ATPase, PMCA-type [Clostridiales bacterium]|nr:calcium-translocating P-type ATPase, PMCA-type [Clostridiales bacterium]